MATPRKKPEDKPKMGRPTDCTDDMAGLTGKQAAFVREYLIDLNATQAALRAGYSEKTSHVIGHENLNKPEIAEAIQKAMDRRAERTEITQDMVLREFAKLGFSDIRKAVKWGHEIGYDEKTGEPVIATGIALTNCADLDEATAAAIAEVSQTKDGLKIKLHDKKAALDSIGRHLGMFRDKVEHTGKDGGAIKHEIKETATEKFAAILNDLSE